jgi:hypothetical protein
LAVRSGLFVGMIKITLQPGTPTASRTNVRDDREAPLFEGAGRNKHTLISEKTKAFYFFVRG